MSLPARCFLTPLTGHIPRHVLPQSPRLLAILKARANGATGPKAVRIGGEVFGSIREAADAIGRSPVKVKAMIRRGEAELCKQDG